MVYNRLFSVQSWLHSPCTLCDTQLPWGQDFCAGCERLLTYPDAVCRRCAAALPQAGVCGACQQQSPSFDRCLAGYRYAAPLDHLIQGLKYHRQLHLARVLGERLAQRLLDQDPCDPGQRLDGIIPVPLHRSRLRQRGYNQALELARPLAREFGLPLHPHALRRIRATAAQSELPLKQRRANVAHAFELDPQVQREECLKGMRIALVDDVMTSGHTVNSAAQCLRRAQVRAIEVWVLART